MYSFPPLFVFLFFRTMGLICGGFIFNVAPRTGVPPLPKPNCPKPPHLETKGTFYPHFPFLAVFLRVCTPNPVFFSFPFTRVPCTLCPPPPPLLSLCFLFRRFTLCCCVLLPFRLFVLFFSLRLLGVGSWDQFASYGC